MWKDTHHTDHTGYGWERKLRAVFFTSLIPKFFLYLCNFKTLFFVVNCLFIERLFLTPDSHSFIVQEHRKVTNFQGTQPKKFFI